MSLIFSFHLLLPNPAYAIVLADGGVVSANASFQPPLLKAVQIDPHNPLSLNFILDKAHLPMTSDEMKQESTRLIEYFLASLTIPEEDLWVNLSPYEQDRIVPKAFGETKMGRDLLLQDADLKQITASLFNPQNPVGKVFWEQVYQKMQKEFGTTDIPVDAFHKVWIVPEKAIVYENKDGSTAYVLESHLKVLTDADYWAMFRHSSVGNRHGIEEGEVFDMKPILYDVIIPVLEKEINQGESFALLRQIYHSLLLATWYKKRILNGFLSEGFFNQKKIQGFNIDKPEEVQQIWQRYTDFFQTGAFHFIHQEKDLFSGEDIPKKYFSGGLQLEDVFKSIQWIYTMDGSEGMIASDPTYIKAIFDLIPDPEKPSIPAEEVLEINSNDIPPSDVDMAERLKEEFQNQFPQNYDLMLSVFGELLIQEEGLKEFFYRLIADEKRPLSEERVAYISSLLRLEKKELGEHAGYPLYFQVQTPYGDWVEKAIQYMDLEQDFLNWAVKMNLPLEEFSLAYGFYIERKEQEKIKQGSQTISRIRPQNQMGKDVFSRVLQERSAYKKEPSSFYRLDLVSSERLSWFQDFHMSEELGDVIQSMGIDISDVSIAITGGGLPKSHDAFTAFLFTKNKNLIRKLENIIQEDLSDNVPLLYAQIQMLDGVPTITALQSRFRFPHSVGIEVRGEIENSLSAFMLLLETHLTAMIQRPVSKVRFLTASFFMLGTKTEEPTLQHYYSAIPRSLNYKIHALPMPIKGLFRPIHFVFEKDLHFSQEGDEDRDFSQITKSSFLSTRRVVYNKGQYTVQYQTRKQPFKSWMSMARALLHIYHRELDKLQKTDLMDEERVNIHSIINHLENGLAQNISQILSMRTSDIQRRLYVLRSAVFENKPHIFIDSANGLNQLSWAKEAELEGVYTQIRVALRIVRDRGIDADTIPVILKALNEAENRLLLNQNLKNLFLIYQKEYLQQRRIHQTQAHTQAQVNAFQETLKKMKMVGDENQKPRVLLLLYQLIFVSSRENPAFFKEINALIHHRPLKTQLSDLLTPTLPNLKPDAMPFPAEVQQAWDSFYLPQKNSVKGGVDLMIKDDSFRVETSSDSQGPFFSDGLSSLKWEDIAGIRTEITAIQTMDNQQMISFLDITPSLSSHQ